MNYKAITLALGAVVLGARADIDFDNCECGSDRVGYCDLNRIQYLVNVAAYEGLTLDNLEGLNELEFAALQSALENVVVELQAQAFSTTQEVLVQTGRVVAAVAVAAAVAGYVYEGICKCGPNMNAWGYSSEVAQERQAWIKNPAEMPQVLKDAKVTAEDLAKFDAIIKANSAVAGWPALKAFGGMVGSWVGVLAGINGFFHTHSALAQNEAIKQTINKVQASLLLLETL